jgi:hypothetical protein
VTQSGSVLSGQILGVAVEITVTQSTRASVESWLRHLLAPPVQRAQPAPGSAPTVRLSATDNIQNLVTQLTWAVLAETPLLGLHAGVVSGPSGLIVVPGHSGLGKTTLVAALVRAGLGYVSDEALAIDRDTLIATAFPRPLALAGDVWPLFADDRDIGPAPPAGREELIDPAVLGRVDASGGRVHDIVLAQRRPPTDGDRPLSTFEPASFEPATLEPSSRAPAVQALLSRAFNHFTDPAASFQAVVALVRPAQVWRATYSHAPDLARLMSQQFG